MQKHLSGYTTVVDSSLLLDPNAMCIFNSIRNEIIRNNPLYISEDTLKQVKSNQNAISILVHFLKQKKIRKFQQVNSDFIKNSIKSKQTILLCSETKINSLDESIKKLVVLNKVV
ncbi:MAG: hypothetical protein KAH84_09075 [Thiomargarita sp.]|nr:hypothetical protein [Thiomargarita sp.]